jgi:hypothetical protein
MRNELISHTVASKIVNGIPGQKFTSKLRREYGYNVKVPDTKLPHPLSDAFFSRTEICHFGDSFREQDGNRVYGVTIKLGQW